MCHYDVSVISRLIVAGQDRGMMRGDYVWFLFTDYAKQSYLQPWTATNLFNGSNSAYRLLEISREFHVNSAYRLTSLYAVNLVKNSSDN